jgi:iron-sulfur cluster assembly protein
MPMNIQLTPAARQRMKTFLADQPEAAGVRFGVRKTGCSGYAYMVEIAERATAGDRVIEQDGVRLVIDTKSVPFVDGTEIDFARQGLNSAFVFRNPNVTGECGCGESFTVEVARAEG